MDADLYYLVGRGRCVKKHPDIVVTQPNAQAGMSVGAIFNKRRETLTYQLSTGNKIDVAMSLLFQNESEQVRGTLE